MKIGSKLCPLECIHKQNINGWMTLYDGHLGIPKAHHEHFVLRGTKTTLNCVAVVVEFISHVSSS